MIFSKMIVQVPLLLTFMIYSYKVYNAYSFLPIDMVSILKIDRID
jgi:hypothetical protein